MGADRHFTFNRFISIISRCGQIYLDRELAPLKIGSGQVRILKALGVQDGISQERIRLLFHLDKATVAKAVKPLLREGYITRERQVEDKRAYRVCLTDKGRGILPRLDEILQAWAQILTAGLTAAEKRAVDALLARMSENARRQWRDHRSTE